MHHKRTYTSGPSYDPRSKKWAEFIYDVCGELTDIDITGRAESFDFITERICPHCHQTSPDGHRNELKRQIEQLSSTKDAITVQIEELTRKLQETENETANTSSEETGTGSQEQPGL